MLAEAIPAQGSWCHHSHQRLPPCRLIQDHVLMLLILLWFKLLELPAPTNTADFLFFFSFFCLKRIKVLIRTALPTNPFKTSSKQALMSSWGSQFFPAQAAPEEAICAYPSDILRELNIFISLNHIRSDFRCCTALSHLIP